MDFRKRVLFLCNGSADRCLMAAAFLRHFATDAFDVYSATFQPDEANPLTIQVMNEIRIDISAQPVNSVEKYRGKLFIHYLITLSPEARKNYPAPWPGVENRLHWSFDDPAAYPGSDEQKLEKFRAVRNQIESTIRQWLAEQDVERRSIALLNHITG